eukprot:3561207-Pyramimonas_sp.AAC.2
MSPFMFGTRGKPVLKLKAAETTWMFRFVVECFLPDYCGDLKRGAGLYQCAGTLLEYTTLLAAQPDVPDVGACAQLERLCIKHLVQCAAAHVPYRPKHHLFWHLTARTAGWNSKVQSVMIRMMRHDGGNRR